MYVGPSITSDVTVISAYTSSVDSAELNEVLVQWEHVVRNVLMLTSPNML